MKPVLRSNKFFMILFITLILSSLFAVPIFFNVMKLNVIQASSLNQWMFLFIPVVIYFLVTKRSVKETLSLKLPALSEVGFVIIIYVVSLPIVGFLGNLSQMFFHNPVAEAFSTMKGMPIYLAVFFIAVTPAICEELVMRGVVLSGYKDVTRWKAAVINGLLFGLFHMNLQQFFYAFAIGIILAYIVRITGSILNSMLYHVLLNGVNSVLAMRALNGPEGKKALEGFANLTRQEIIVTLVLQFIFAVAAVAIIVIILKTMNKNAQIRRIQAEIEMGRTPDEIREHMEVLTAKSNEKIINWPLIVVFVIYFAWNVLLFKIGKM